MTSLQCFFPAVVREQVEDKEQVEQVEGKKQVEGKDKVK